MVLFKISKITKKFSIKQCELITKKLNLIWAKESFSIFDFKQGLEVEFNEHQDVHKGNPLIAAKIALSHLRESSLYYKELELIEN